MITKKLLLILISITILAMVSCKEKPKPKEVAKEPAKEVVQDTVKPESEPIVEVKEPEPVKKIQKYFLIAGCFEYKENADRLTEKLTKEGYDSKIISYYENLYLVSYDGFPTRDEALTALRKLRQENDKKDTWIYPTK